MEAQRKNDFSKGSIAKNILSLAIPLTVAQLTVVLYNVVDRAFIGHIDTVGRDAFTGIGLVMPITYIITAFANLCGTGGAPLCAIARGRGDDKRAARIMGVSFTFLGSLLMICTNPKLGYEGMVGAVILGGIFEGVVGLSAKYWKKYLTPVVSACVVIAIGLSLLPVGMNSWGGGSGSETFGAWYHLLVGCFTLVVCLVSRYLLKGVYKNLNILVGLIFGYILSGIFTAAGIAPMIDFSGISKTIGEVGFFSIPQLVFLTSHKPLFDIGAFFTIAIVFLVSAAETTGATTAVCTGTLGRDIKIEELQGSLAVDGFSSTISGCFGCLPLTSFSQNVGLVTMTGVINRFTILMGALILILASLFPPLGAFFNSLPQSVLGGCTVMMFGSIMYEGVKMLKECVFDDRTMILVSLAFCIGVGLTQTSGNFFAAFPQAVGDIFNGNAVAGVFVVSLILSFVLPKEKKPEAGEE